MSILRLVSRCAETALKLPFAVTWDFISLGNMGETACTTKVLREHQAKKQVDDLKDLLEKINANPFL